VDKGAALNQLAQVSTVESPIDHLIKPGTALGPVSIADCFEE
jgi:hypothetical protein